MATQTHMMTTPYWMESSLPRFPKIERGARVDVVIVGGGITGLTAAYLIAKTGRSVALLERSRCAEIDPGHTTAHLTMVTDLRLVELVDRFSRNHAQAVWDAGLAAIAQIDTIVRDENLSCAFRWVPGYLHHPMESTPEKDVDMFTQEAALATEMGFDATFVSTVPFVGGPGVRFENQARF